MWHVRGTTAHRRLPDRPPDSKKGPVSGAFLRGRDRRRSGDLALFRRALCQLSYPTSLCRSRVLRTTIALEHHPADLTGFEPATSGLTGRRALQAAPQVPADAGLPTPRAGRQAAPEARNARRYRGPSGPCRVIQAPNVAIRENARFGVDLGGSVEPKLPLVRSERGFGLVGAR